MAATLSVEDETQLKALMEKINLKLNEVKTIEDLLKVLLKVKREGTTPKKTKFSFGAEEDVSSNEDEDGEEKGAKTVPKLTWFCRNTPVLKGNLSFKAWKFEVEGLKGIYGKRVFIQAMKWSLQSPATDVVQCLGIKPKTQ